MGRSPGPAPIDPATLHIPGYTVVKVLGQGAQGVVLRATSDADDRPVAIKVLSDADVEQYRARFSRESQVLLRIEHPNVVGALDLGRTDANVPYLVMEFVEGETLADRLRRAALSEAEVLPLLRQAAEGLAAIHAHQLVHRDLKPENLMITRDGVVKLMDLGLAKQLEGGEDLTVTGSVFGTPGFMSPEAARDSKDVDIRADIYSLGCTLYQALTRRLPFEEKSIGKLLRRVLTQDPTPPTSHRADLTPPMVALIGKLLARDRADRPPDPAALIADLDRVADGEMPAARARRRGWWPFGRK